jgi:hypothetical protein
MKTTKQSKTSAFEAALTRVRLNFLLLACISFLGATSTGHSWIPCPPTATNGLAEAVDLKRAFVTPIRTSNSHDVDISDDLRLKAYLFWWELKDDVRYGLPDMIRNERPTLVLAGLGLAALTWIAFKPRLRPHLKASRLENRRANRPLKPTRVNT